VVAGPRQRARDGTSHLRLAWLEAAGLSFPLTHPARAGWVPHCDPLRERVPSEARRVRPAQASMTECKTNAIWSVWQRRGTAWRP
jgi:hypothetical protein